MTTALPDDKALRKAWLKRKFASFEYHEEMLRIHAQWLALIERSLARPGVRRDYPELHKFFTGPARKNFDMVAKPGTISAQQFKPGQTFGAAIFILDYNRDSGLDIDSNWDWMPADEQERLYELWGQMGRMARNIQYTVDGVWDEDPSDADWILEERYTGPIAWPPNWREEVLGPQATPAPGQATAPRVTAGRPVPVAGTWQALHPGKQRLKLQAGDVPPDLHSAYGITLWERVGD